MKIACTVCDVGLVFNAGGDAERTTYILDIPVVPKELTLVMENPHQYMQVTFSAIKEVQS